MNSGITNYSLPRYDELPNVGLYLEQTVTYINETLAPFEVSITQSMLSNYVKQGYISRPVKKLYDADQIAYLIFIVLAKLALSMDQIRVLMSLQEQTHSLEHAYNYFISGVEDLLKFMFECEYKPEHLSGEQTFATKTMNSVILAVSNIIYLNHCLKEISKEKQE